MMRRWHVWVTIIILLVALASATAALAQQRTHVVQPGETLYRIALRYGVTVEQIAAANGITNPALIYVGQVLIIPGGGGASAGTTTYTVVAGDTLYSIARRFDTTVDRLIALNGLANPNVLYVGQVLVVPLPAQFTPTAATPTSLPTVTGTPPTASPGPTLTPTPSGPLTHVVQPGETLYRIALRHGTTVQELVILNNLPNPNLIYVGQVLIIRPGPPPTPTAIPTATLTPTATASPMPTSTSTATPIPTATTYPTATLTPTANPDEILTPTPIVPDVEIPPDAPNLFVNPSFEGETRVVLFDDVKVFPGWEPFYCDTPYTAAKCPALRQGSGNPEGLTMARPRFSAADLARRVAEGLTAQQWSCRYASCRAGVYQTVATVPGAVCEAGIAVQSWSTNSTSNPFSDLVSRDDRDNSTWFIRIDLNGGTDAFASGPNMLISRGFGYDDGIYDQYAVISYIFTSTGERTTVFFENLRLWPFARNSNYVDNAYLRCTVSPSG